MAFRVKELRTEMNQSQGCVLVLEAGGFPKAKMELVEISVACACDMKGYF